MSRFKEYLSEIFRLSTQRPRAWREALGAGARIALPVAMGAAIGNMPAGLNAAAGALMVSSGRGRQHDDAGSAVGPFCTAALAIGVAAIAAHRTWLTDALIALLAAAAATAASFSRAAAITSTRFILFLVLVTVVLDATEAPFVAAALMGGAALLAMGVSTASAALTGVRPTGAVRRDEIPPRGPSFRNKLARWRRIMAEASGWHLALRIFLGLSAAGIVRWLLPQHHFFWIAITVVLLTERQTEWSPVKSTQRIIGTLLGILAVGLFPPYSLPSWALVAIVAALGSLRSLAREMSYLAQSAVMTPLIFLMIDRGSPPTENLLLDRILATLSGAAIVFVSSIVVRRLAPSRKQSSPCS